MYQEEKEIDYYFTFGSNHIYPNNYIKIHGTFISAREKMIERFGTKWCWPHSKIEDVGIKKFKLKELKS